MNDTAENWAAIRLRYEQATETVAQIAADIALTPHKLTLRARAEGWTMRSTSRKKSQSTRETIKRLKELLQNRLAHMETQISILGNDISALESEREIRATSTLARTLEKVLELEHKERKQRQHLSRKTRKLDDAERDELAKRLEALQPQPEELDQFSAAQSSDGNFAGLADVGANGPTST